VKREPSILVVDNATHTGDLLEFAAEWSRMTRASVRLVRIIDQKVLKDTTMAVDAIGPIAGMIKDDLIRKSLQEIEPLSERYGLSGVMEVSVTVGSMMEEVTRAVDATGADFLILSSALRGPLGSIVSEVVGYNRSNSIVLPPGRHRLTWKRILLATDCSARAEAAAETALEAAGRFGSRLFILSVISSNEEVQIHAPALLDKMADERRASVRRLVEQAAGRGVHAEGIVREGTVSDILIDLAHTIHADVIVMGSEGRTGLSRLFMGSVAGSIVSKVACPVLAIKKPFVFSNG